MSMSVEHLERNKKNCLFTIKYAKLQIKLTNRFGIPQRFLSQMEHCNKVNRLNRVELKNLWVNFLKRIVKSKQRGLQKAIDGTSDCHEGVKDAFEFDEMIVSEFLCSFKVVTTKQIKTIKF